MGALINKSGQKVCSHCRELKPFGEFSTNNRRPPHTAAGRKSVCKPCWAAAVRERNREPGESKRRAAANRRWRIENAAVAICSKAKSRARRTGLAFTITPADLAPLPTNCPVLGFPLEYGARLADKLRAPSLDRINNSKGYIPGNVRVISFRANILKRDATLAELRALVTYCERNTIDDII